MIRPEQPAMSEREGYLVVETRADRTGLVRVYAEHRPPIPSPEQSTDPQQPRVRYVASFPALHVARMHAQTALRRYMVDAETGLYRVDPVTAIAAVEAIDLSHRRVYLDPDLASDPNLSEQVERRRKLHLWRNRFWTGVGLLGILLLILLSQIPVF